MKIEILPWKRKDNICFTIALGGVTTLYSPQVPDTFVKCLALEKIHTTVKIQKTFLSNFMCRKKRSTEINVLLLVYD